MKYFSKTWLILLIGTVLEGETKYVTTNSTADLSKQFPQYILQLSELMNFTDLVTLNQTYNYLTKYGYMEVATKSVIKLNKKGNNLSTQKLIHRLVNVAIGEFQKFNQLTVTELLDTPTLKKLREPRCGNADMGKEAKKLQNFRLKRAKRFSLAGSRWKNKTLDYCISIYSIQAYKSGELDLVDREIERAVRQWTKYFPYSIKRSECTRNGRQYRWASMDMRWAKREHGDGDPFDGPGKVLAHAYYPIFGGDVHFDDEEQWDLDNSGKGVNLFTVALHEIGHALGLDHSDNPGSIMVPIYPKYRPDLTVGQDDIDAIKKLYSKKLKHKSTVAPKSPTSKS